MKYQRKIAWPVLLIIFALANFTITIDARAGESRELVIQRVVFPDANPGTAIIMGNNFPDSNEARVSLAGIELTIVDATETMIEVQVPELDVGEYLLTVYKEKKGPQCEHGSQKYCDEYDLSIGVQGLKGASGPEGPMGDKGERGPKGATGLQGPNGKDGADGAPGRPGDPGKNGANGKAGSNGVDGKDGAPGPRGEPGPPGDNQPDPVLVDQLDDAVDYICEEAGDQKPDICYLKPGPQTVNFFVLSDPQYGWGGPGGGDNISIREYGIRASATIRQLASLIDKCSDCSKILPIAGDLTNADGNAYTEPSLGFTARELPDSMWDPPLGHGAVCCRSRTSRIKWSQSARWPGKSRYAQVA